MSRLDQDRGKMALPQRNHDLIRVDILATAFNPDIAPR
jgi:hypothetical protein